MSVGPESRHNYSAVIRILNSSGLLVEHEHRDIRPRLQRIVHADNSEYVPSKTDNWSRISWKTLGHGRHWWIIADFSGVVDPFTDLHPEPVTRYITQLGSTLSAGEQTSAILLSSTRIKRGMRLKIEDLDTSGPKNSVEVSVLSTNDTTGLIEFSPVTVPAGGIPFTLSRVSQIHDVGAKLTIPSIHRALFQSLDFGNPLNVLVE